MMFHDVFHVSFLIDIKKQLLYTCKLYYAYTLPLFIFGDDLVKVMMVFHKKLQFHKQLMSNFTIEYTS